MLLLSFAILMGASLAVSLPLIVPIAIAVTVPITPAVALFPLVVTEAFPAVMILLSLLTLLPFTGGRRSSLRGRGSLTTCLRRLGRMRGVGTMRSVLGSRGRRR
jgi:hypothetical protein